MQHHPQHDSSYRQEREQKKEARTHPEPGTYLSSVHPAWYVIVGVITIGAAVLIWTFIVW